MKKFVKNVLAGFALRDARRRPSSFFELRRDYAMAPQGERLIIEIKN